MRLAFLISHPVQYYSPLFVALAARCELHVFYGQRMTATQQEATEFRTHFDWDIDLLSGYRSTFLENVARNADPNRFFGCDTPEFGRRLREGFDALVVAGWYQRCHVQAILSAKRVGIPVLIRGDSHLDTPRASLKRFAKEATFPLLLRAFDGALYVGKRNRAYYEHYHYPSERLFFSPHCVDGVRFAAGATIGERAALRARLGLGSMDKVALFAGKLVGRKRPFDLIDAAAIARAQGQPLQVVVAGSGPLEADLRSRARAARVPLHLLGFQNQSRMPASYAAADVLALPSEGEETWGLVCNEALACGLPIVVSDAVGCAPDLAADGHVGRTFPVGDTRAFAKALASTVIKPPSKSAIRAISDRYDLAAAADGIVAALANVCHAREQAD